MAGVAAAQVGEIDEARRYVSRARTAYGDRPWGFQSEWAHYAEAALTWREAGPAAAVPTLGRWSPGSWPWTPAMAIPPLVDLAELGRAARATGEAPPAGWRPWRNAATSTATGRCWRWPRAGRPSLAVTARRRRGGRPGGRGAVGLDWPFYSGRARGLLGLSDRRPGPGRRSAAVRRRDLRRHGSMVRRAEALDALGRLGSAGKRAAAAASGPASLTSREREVATLAAAGLSAKEIGERLFIGERTVESHLARAYAKLGVRSKVELARRGPNSASSRDPEPTGTDSVP